MRIGPAALAGLLAGLWINVSGMCLVRFVLGADYVRSMLAHVPHPAGPGMMVRHLGIRFAFGILCVLLYAALRPRFDHGTGAALAAAAFLYFAAYVPLAAMLQEFEILVGWRLWVTMVWGAGEVVVAALAGAFLYEKIGG